MALDKQFLKYKLEKIKNDRIYKRMDPDAKRDARKKNAKLAQEEADAFHSYITGEDNIDKFDNRSFLESRLPGSLTLSDKGQLNILQVQKGSKTKKRKERGIIDFRKKFYKFFLRMFLSTTVAGWTNRTNGFSSNYYSGGKRRQVNDMMTSTFGNNELCHGHLTIDDANKLVEDIANSKMSFKSYCVKNFLPSKTTDSYGYDRIEHKTLPGSGQYGESYAKIQVDQIWPDVEIPVTTTSS